MRTAVFLSSGKTLIWRLRRKRTKHMKPLRLIELSKEETGIVDITNFEIKNSVEDFQTEVLHRETASERC